MKSKFLWYVICIGVLVLAVSIGALAQSPKQFKLSGLINDYTPANLAGPWEIRGDWSMNLKGESGKASFSAALTMEHSDLGVSDLNSPAQRSAHTHHITLVNGTVTPIANGFRVTGTAMITGNGNYPPPFGGNSTLQIDVIGGNSLALSNIKVTFGGDAATHFGTQAVNGVVLTSN